jgi:hypothetical protein
VQDRRLYDSIDDYNGYSDSSNALTTLAGRSISIGGSETFTRAVSVTSGVRPVGHTVAPAGDFAVVKVTVTGSGGSSVTLSQLMMRTTYTR